MKKTWLRTAMFGIVSALCLEAVILCLVVAARANSWNITFESLTKPIVDQITYGTGPDVDRKIYLFSIGDDLAAHEYINEGGDVVGFGVDIIDLICTEAGIDCRTVWTRYDRCWESRPGQDPVGGIGLHGGWIDACAGWYNTVERAQIFQFSAPYLQAQDTFIFFETDSSFDGKDIRGMTIGFLSGWASDPSCLARQSSVKNRVLNKSQIDYSITTEQALRKLRSKKIDAIMLTYEGMKRHLTADNRLSYFQTMPMKCMLAGNSIMAQKTSDLPAKWNVGFHKVRINIKYTQLCQRARVKYGHRGSVDCLSSY